MSVSNMIETKDLTKQFNGFTAVDHINISVKEGEIFGLLGPNGAGKTTTISMLITLLRPTEGTATVAGYDVKKDPDKVRKHIGVVFQDTSIDRYLTGYENMWLHGKLYNIPSNELKTRIKELLEFVELWDKKDVELRKYSGGMIRRLEIARGLLHTPDVLFLDEPTLGLDPHTRAHIWDYIKKLKKEKNMTILLTTHYMDEADKLCDRIAIIDHGKIIAEGTPEELKSSLGGDVIYLKLHDGPTSYRQFMQALKQTNFNGTFTGVSGGTLTLTVKSATKTIPELFDIALKAGVKIEEIRYTKPTLDDVFLKLTGRKLRPESGDAISFMKDRMRLRFSRRGFHR
ncbi:MAG: ABC transporter ATP-binding protein [Candidatus Asgardarchaeum californiense]|nr:MAG: ABC transporter ATP-binding protein [Candidatus Asgardarchaeum californiense]